MDPDVTRTALPRCGPPRRGTAVAAAAALSLAAACGGQSGGSGEGDRQYAQDGTLVMLIGGDPGPLDPHAAGSAGHEPLTTLAYDRLAVLGPDDELLPNVATSWEVTPTSVTWTVRDDVTCADGSALTPSVMARSFAYVQDPANQSPLLGPTLPVGSTVTADDAASTLTVTAATPYAYLLKGSSEIELVCEAGLDDRSLLQDGTAGSGPFVLESSKTDEEYVLARREGYGWGPPAWESTDAEGFPAELVLRVVGDETTAANLLLTGEAQIAPVLGSARTRLSGQDGLTEVVIGRGGAFGLLLNQQGGRPGADPAVRRAMVAATDVEQVRAVMTGGRGEAPTDITVSPSPCTDGSVMDAAPPYDPEAAADLLEEAGWTGKGTRSKGGAPLAFKLLYGAGVGGEDVPAGMELLAAQWKEVGADVQLVPVDPVAFNEALFGTGDWDATLVGFSPDEPGYATGFISGPPPPDGLNVGGIANPEFDAAAAQAVTVPGEQGCELWYEAERALLAAGDYRPVTNLTVAYYGNGAEFELGGPFGEPIPTSYRVLE